MAAKLVRRGVLVDVARRIDIAVADAVGQRDVPHPAGAHRGRAGADAGAVGGQRGRRDHRAVVEQIAVERQMPPAQRGLGDDRAEAAGVDEQVGLEPAAVVGHQRGDIARPGKLDRRDPRVDVRHAPRGRDLAQIAPDQHRIEMIAVAGLERKIGRGQRRQPALGKPVGHEEAVGMRGHVGAVATEPGIAHQVGRGVAVEVAREGVEIALEARLVGPAVERDPDLVGGVAARHPLASAIPSRSKKCFSCGVEPSPTPMIPMSADSISVTGPARSPGLLQQAGRHPSGGAAAKDARSRGGRRPVHLAVNATANPPPPTIRTSMRVAAPHRPALDRPCPCPSRPLSAVGPSR